MEKKELSCTVGGNVHCYGHYGEQNGDSFKKKTLGIKFPNDPAISLLGIYPRKTTILKDTCSPVFTVALFTITGT